METRGETTSEPIFPPTNTSSFYSEIDAGGILDGTTYNHCFVVMNLVSGGEIISWSRKMANVTRGDFQTCFLLSKN